MAALVASIVVIITAAAVIALRPAPVIAPPEDSKAVQRAPPPPSAYEQRQTFAEDAARRCQAAMRAKWPGLEPASTTADVSVIQGIHATIRYPMRVRDSFSAATVGRIECIVVGDGPARVEKLRE